MSLLGLSIIGPRRAQAQGEAVRAINPATGTPLDPAYHPATRDDLDEAVNAAATAFQEYGQWDGVRRGRFLRAIATHVEAAAETIQARAHLETGLPLARLQGETARTCNQLRLFADLVEDGGWQDARIDTKPNVRSLRVPMGPVAVFAASNFPLAFSVAGGDTASALAAGCPVIVKPHEGHLGTSELVGMCIMQAARASGAPAGVFSLLYGPGPEIGGALVQHPGIHAVGFTGSHRVGRRLMDLAAARATPIPVFAEMGSVNPVFLLPDALAQDQDALAAGLHGSLTLGVGQFCTNPGLVLLEKGDAADTFKQRLAERVAATPPAPMLTLGLRDAYCAGLARALAVPGVKQLAGLQSAADTATAVGCAALLETDADTFLANPILTEEVFGPVTLLVTCDDALQMLALATSLPGQLTASVHGSEAEMKTYRNLLDVLQRKVGRLIYNGFPTGVEVCHAMVHGGPYPATSDGRSTSVGSLAIERFARPVSFQGFPDSALPPALQDDNPLGIRRLVDGMRVGPEDRL